MSTVDAARLAAVADRVHALVWERFVSPDGVLYDYVGPQGEVDLPTAGECAELKPNALGWWSPIENGGFFTGLYLIAQCQRCARTGAAADRAGARNLVRGLCRLQDIATVPGVIARGIADDGTSHYPASSVDQVFPWLLGLDRYLATDIPTADERVQLEGRLKRQLSAIGPPAWTIPGERPGFEGGVLTRAEAGYVGDMAAVHLATAIDMLAAPAEELLTTPLEDGRTRLERIAAGIPEHPAFQGWIITTCQYALRRLWRRSRDETQRARFAAGLLATGRAAAEFIGHCRRHDPRADRPFTPDWRVMLAVWRPQENRHQAVELAIEQLRLWQEACPAVQDDKSTLMHAITAALNVVLANDGKLVQAHLPDILAAIEHFNYAETRYAALFFVENLVEALLDHDNETV